MIRNPLVAAHMLLLFTFSPAIAQRGGQSIPTAGTRLPSVTVIDDQPF